MSLPIQSSAILALGIALTAGCLRVPAQAPCRLVKDINAIDNPQSSNPAAERRAGEGFVRCGAYDYFSAATLAEGRELWRTDGTAAGTRLVKDIHPGLGDANPRELTCAGGQLFFRADDGMHGAELWATDGTASGTRLVRDIRIGPLGSTPSSIASLRNRVFFSAFQAATGAELWVSDGTAAGTRQVKDISSGNGSGSPRNITANTAGTLVLFEAWHFPEGLELWRSDGTTAGTGLVRDIGPGAASGGATNFLNLGPTTLFTAFGRNGTELWQTDGTSAGTVEVKDIYPGTRGANPRLHADAILGGKAYFAATDPVHGTELWRTDGTPQGTVLAVDIVSGTASSVPGDFLAIGNAVYFTADTPATGRELWRFDVGTGVASLVKDLRIGPFGSSPAALTAFGSRFLFRADLGNDSELFISDGTPAGTTLVRDLHPTRGSEPTGFTVLSSTRAIFAADDGTSTGRELWETDGTAAGTSLFKDIEASRATRPSLPSHLSPCFGDKLYFRADDGVHGPELWISDGTGAGTRMVKDIRPGLAGSAPAEVFCCWVGTKSVALFRAEDGTHGAELWTTDGTAAGTRMVKDLWTGGSSSPTGFTCAAGKVFFLAKNRGGADFLWMSDGTAAGTQIVMGFRFATEIVGCAGRVFVAGSVYGSGHELWVSDGTASGTKLVADLNPGVLPSSPRHLTCFHNKVLFQASVPTMNPELWISDGTAAGTFQLEDIYPGTMFGSAPSQLTAGHDAVYFTASDASRQTELYVTDGTTAGTRLVKDIATSSSFPEELTFSQGKLFFRLGPGFGGPLWVSDGTAAGTKAVTNLPYAGHLVAASSGIYFATAGGPAGSEVYFSDGTPAGTRLVCDIYPGPGPASPSTLTLSDGRLFVAAFHPATDRELYVIEEDPATARVLGTGCGPQTPTLRSTHPIVGGSVTLSGRDAPTGARLLVAGLPSEAFFVPGLRPHCGIYVNIFQPFGVLAHPVGSSWSWTLPLANDPGLIGVEIGIQGAYEPTPLSLSNAVHLRLGN